MSEGGQMMLALPRPGRALKGVLIVIAVFGVVQALLYNWIPGGAKVFLALAYTHEEVARGQVWRLLTAGLLSHPEHPGHLIFTLIGLYFLSPDLERRWGGARFLRFLALSVLIGNVLTFLVESVAAGHGGALHPGICFGAFAACTAVGVAWARANENAQVFLFFFPVSGKALFWITIAYCFLGLIYPGANPEGAVAPFGGVVSGLLLGGSPSVMRELYLRAKLGVLRRQGDGPSRGGPRGPGKRSRAGSPPLRVVQGGVEEELRKREPPKDKRYLN
jgi:membrane associated rhomboid family serine protease